MIKDTQQLCPLCLSENAEHYIHDKRRSYLHCLQCDLVFVPKCYHLSEQEEKKEYDLHNNNANDLGYLQFLNRVFEPLSKLLNKGEQGLDFGSGPGPSLHLMFLRAGFEMKIYDKYYASDLSVLSKQYHFITATEVFEHLRKPKKDIDLLFKLLKPGAKIAIMTKRVKDKSAFKQWHYKNDQTHICFYSLKTFEWLARKYKAKIKYLSTDVIILEK